MIKVTINTLTNISRLPTLMLASILLYSCAGEDRLSSESVIDKTYIMHDSTELDTWIYENYTKPYGIEVKARWDKNDVSPESYLYPPTEEKVKEALEVIKTLWIDFYTRSDVGGANFFKERNPIRIYMYGSVNQDVNGVEMISNPDNSVAEMSLYGINDFDRSDTAKVYMLMRSVHQQFTRRLSTLVPYDRDTYMQISRKRYSASTATLIAPLLSSLKGVRVSLYLPNRYANIRGMLTFYSFLSPELDFTEIASSYLTDAPRVTKQALIEAATPDVDPVNPDVQAIYDEEARAAYAELSAKISFVKSYFSKAYGFDLEELQIISQKEMNAFFAKQISTSASAQ